MLTRLIVCSAIRHKDTGEIICGPRHGDCLKAVMRYGVDNDPSALVWDLGFVDQDNNFLTRAEAWKVADAAGQIRRPTGYEQHYKHQRKANIGDDGFLFSENLY